jgi:hypothetical protein
VLQPKQYTDFCVGTDQVKLRRPEAGKNLQLTINDRRYEIGRLASAFPLSWPLETVVFFDAEGEEIGVMKQVGALDQDSQRVLLEELDKAYFMPRIEAIVNLQENLGVERWLVLTDKGERTFEVRSPRRNVRSIGNSRVIIKDVDGNRYEVRNWRRLDRGSIAFLMRHL